MDSGTNTDVYLKDGCRYNHSSCADALDIILRNLTRDENVRSATILLKPNLISSVGPSHACSDGSFLSTIARWFLDNGAKVRIGDSPAYGTTQSVFIKQGLTDCIKGLPVKLVNFKTPVVKDLGNGISVGIAAEALDADFLINIPRLKAHKQMYITAAVKNYFGTVVGLRKPLIHIKNGGTRSEFADILIRLPSLFPKTFSVIDCIEIMNRTGPMDGEMIRMGFVGGCRCAVSLDCSLLKLPGMVKERSPLYKAAVELGHPGTVDANINYPFVHPDKVTDVVFKGPESLTPVRFTPHMILQSMSKRLKLAFHS